MHKSEFPDKVTKIKISMLEGHYGHQNVSICRGGKTDRHVVKVQGGQNTEGEGSQ